jgi:hypothetical protein
MMKSEADQQRFVRVAEQLDLRCERDGKISSRLHHPVAHQGGTASARDIRGAWNPARATGIGWLSTF